MKKQIIQAIKERYSPLIFDNKEILEEIMTVLLESGTLAASSYNNQPWRFIWAAKGTEGYEKLYSFLSEYNQEWTSTAPVLMIAIAEVVNEKGKGNYHALYDLGQAVSSMAVQASSMGIQFHQMGGFDCAKATEELKVSSNFALVSMIAMGYPGDKNLLNEHFYKRAHEPRVRKSLKEISGGVDFFR